MRFEEVQSPTAQTEYRGGDLYYRRANRPNRFLVVFVSVWLCGWTVGGIAATGALFRPDGPFEGKLFIAFWLVAWALGWAFAAFSIAWSLAGAESVTANTVALTHGMHVGPWKYERHYKPGALSNLQWRDGSEWPAFVYGRGSKPAAITADYGVKTLAFLRGISRPEAALLIEKLRPALGMRKVDA